MNDIHPKVTAAASGAGVGSAVIAIVVWILSLQGITVPTSIVDALGVIVAAVLAFIAGYMTPSPKGPVAAPVPPAVAEAQQNAN